MSTFTPQVGLLNRENCLPSNARYMFERITDEMKEQSHQIDYIASQVMKKHSLADADANNIPFQVSVTTYGRISNADDSRLSDSTVLLEGSTRLSGGTAVPLSLDATSSYSLFPGQTVAIQATNPTGELLLAEEVFDETFLPSPQLPHFTVKEGPLHIVVAAGPFTQIDTMNYQPLEDLIQYVLKHRPHVLILIGPFVDSAHPHIADGSLAETFDAHFEKMIEGLAEQVKSCNTRVVLVSSWRDAHHQMVYPTPPYALRKCPINVTLVSDPTMLNIHGLVIGVTSADIIKHLASQEISKCSQGTNRFYRLAKHVLSQQCFYPLYPPAEEMNMDSELFGLYAHMDVKPHILILPSDMRYFIKEIDGCVIVNPERLAKGIVGGTFARFEIAPPATDTKETFTNNISCNVVRI